MVVQGRAGLGNRGNRGNREQVGVAGILGNQLWVELGILGNQLWVEPGILGNHKGVEPDDQLGRQDFVAEGKLQWWEVGQLALGPVMEATVRLHYI